MIQHISLIIKRIKDDWDNYKNAANINQERQEPKGFAEVPKDEAQNCCKSNCACKQIKKPKKIKDARKN